MVANFALRIETPRAYAPLLSPSRYKGAFGGRGSGKSHFFAERMAELTAFDEMRCVCIREVQKSLDQSVKLLLEDKIQKLGLGHYFKVTDRYIEGRRNKSLITFQGMQNHTAESIKSLEGYDIAWVEEAQSLSSRSLELLRPTIRKDEYPVGFPLKTSELWFSWNPRFATDPVDNLLRGDDLPPNSIVVNVNYEDNPWFPKILQEEMEYDRSRDPDAYEHIWLGGYEKNSEARVFRNWRIEEFETPEDAKFLFGADWGFAVDPTVMIRCYIVGRTLYVDQEAYKVRCPIDKTPALFDTIPGSRLWVCRADSARPETINYCQNNGFPKMIAAKKGAGSVEEGIEFLKKFDIVVHPRCRHTSDELTRYSFKVDPKTKDILPVLADSDNNVIDSLRYAVEGERRAESSIGLPRQVH